MTRLPAPPRTVRQCLGQRAMAVWDLWDAHPERAHLLESMGWPLHSGCGQAMAACIADRTVYAGRVHKSELTLARDLEICVLG